MKKSLVLLVAGILFFAGVAAVYALGPHGGYSASSDKCSQCHDVHEAPSAFHLLPYNTIWLTCNSCHDGTTARKVYGNIPSPGADHYANEAGANATSTVPGSPPNTIDSTLSCAECHSPHANNVVNYFYNDTAWTFAYTPRLLKRDPNSSATGSYPNYGGGWCADCHQNRHNGTSLANHPVSTSTIWDAVWYWTGTTYATQSLGPITPINPNPHPRYLMRDRSGIDDPDPICQQCHEDSRDVETTFTVTDYIYVASDNPQYKDFPHETVNPKFEVETGDDLCLNCHDTSQLP
jgi:hypothetical protein